MQIAGKGLMDGVVRGGNIEGACNFSGKLSSLES